MKNKIFESLDLTHEQRILLAKFNSLDLNEREKEAVRHIEDNFKKDNSYKALREHEYIRLLLSLEIIDNKDLEFLDYLSWSYEELFSKVFPLFDMVVAKEGIDGLEISLRVFRDQCQFEFAVKNLYEYFSRGTN
ncbi:hypothetical protein [Enterococcus sp. BWR-S5]|uniref:hypothetical protein n=1 Tax=Enterococcus sp. BWR-S5 TaxID=2787714 RepID=UPI001921E124|nr:hypothetical protein [Enterococcus sp. BWR-S5]MBL1227068.1 hypothetical protein [Enterococcus sp. BWR-S5]